MPSPSLSPASAASRPTVETSPITGASLTPNDPGTVPLWRSGVVLILVVVVALSYWLNPPLDIQSQAGVVMDLPVIVGDYFGKKGEMNEAEHATLPEDTELTRRFYLDSHGHQIEGSIVLSGSEQRSIHRPEGCLTGQGWTVVNEKQIPIPLASGHPLTAEAILLSRQETNPSGGVVTVRALYVYWFVGQNVTTPSEMERVLLSNWDRVIHNRAHRWAYVSMFALITDNLSPNGLDAAQTQALLVDFCRQIVPTFQISEMPSQASN